MRGSQLPQVGEGGVPTFPRKGGGGFPSCTRGSGEEPQEEIVRGSKLPRGGGREGKPFAPGEGEELQEWGVCP